MGQAKNRGTREQRVATAQHRDADAAAAERAIVAGRQQALARAAKDDQRDPPRRAAVVGGVSPRMRLALAGIALAIDRVGTVTVKEEAQ